MRKGKQSFLLFAISIATAFMIAAAPAPYGVSAETTVVRSGTFEQSVWLNGTVQYAQAQKCICPTAGRISAVYVQPGKPVIKDELLFQLDTSAQEKALASLYENKYAREKLVSMQSAAANALIRQSEESWEQSCFQLTSVIRTSQIRAQADGIMENVYFQEGNLVNEGALLGTVRGKKKIVATQADYADACRFRRGMGATITTGNLKLSATIEHIQAPDENGMQMIRLECDEMPKLEELEAGETVLVEVITDAYASAALVPLAASDADGRIWKVVNGVVQSEAFDWSDCNRAYACADNSWTGQTVILYPEQYRLSDGMRVRVMK